MGRILASVTVASFVEPECHIRCDALVDTGAYCLTLPAAWKEKLGSRLHVRRLETADQRLVEGELWGPVQITIEGFDAVFGEVLFLNMEPVNGRYEPLLGYVTLEQAGIAVDMLGHRLLRLPHLDLKPARTSLGMLSG